MGTGTLSVRLSILPLMLGITSLIGGFILHGTVVAATYYVAQDGSDSNAGSESEPFKTIRHGISQIEAGDTLYIRAGTYGELIDNSEMIIPTGNSWDTPVTIAAYPGETVVFRPAFDRAVINLEGSHIQYLVFDGLVVDGNSIRLVNGANHVRFINVEVKNSPGLGVMQFSGDDEPSIPTYNEFINMKVHDGESHGIYVTSSHNLIEGCDVYDNAEYGIHIYRQGGGGVNDNTVRSSRVYDNGWGGGTTAGIILGSGSGNAAYDNEVWGNYIGIQIASGGPVDTHVENNTVHDNTAYGITISTDSLNTVVEGNDVYDNGVEDIVDLGTGTVLSNN